MSTILKKVAPEISESLCKLFNVSLHVGELPASWKVAAVIPIFKNTGKPAEVTRYRPISLLPAIAKVLDSLVAENLSTYLNSQKIISPHQFAFVPSKSTVDQLVQLAL